MTCIFRNRGSLGLKFSLAAPNGKVTLREYRGRKNNRDGWQLSRADLRQLSEWLTLGRLTAESYALYFPGSPNIARLEKLGVHVARPNSGFSDCSNSVALPCRHKWLRVTVRLESKFVRWHQVYVERCGKCDKTRVVTLRDPKDFQRWFDQLPVEEKVFIKQFGRSASRASKPHSSERVYRFTQYYRSHADFERELLAKRAEEGLPQK